MADAACRAVLRRPAAGIVSARLRGSCRTAARRPRRRLRPCGPAYNARSIQHSCTLRVIVSGYVRPCAAFRAAALRGLLRLGLPPPVAVSFARRYLPPQECFTHRPPHKPQTPAASLPARAAPGGCCLRQTPTRPRPCRPLSPSAGRIEQDTFVAPCSSLVAPARPRRPSVGLACRQRRQPPAAGSLPCAAADQGGRGSSGRRRQHPVIGSGNRNFEQRGDLPAPHKKEKGRRFKKMPPADSVDRPT